MEQSTGTETTSISVMYLNASPEPVCFVMLLRSSSQENQGKGLHPWIIINILKKEELQQFKVPFPGLGNLGFTQTDKVWDNNVSSLNLGKSHETT